MSRLTVIGLGAMLTLGICAESVVSTTPGSRVQSFTGQVREITIDQFGLEPGTCEGTLVLA
jgi:hypothetical protein